MRLFKFSTIQEREFVASIISDDLLQKSVIWIQNNLAPDEVFSEYKLKDWAENNGYGYVVDEE